MIRITLGFFLALQLLSCQRDKVKEAVEYSMTNQQGQKELPTVVKSERKEKAYAILPFDEKPANILEGATTSTLTQKEIDEVYSIVQTATNEFNIARKNRFGDEIDTIDLNEYRLQLVPVITSEGEKIVWVNAFCSDKSNWSKTRVEVLDGGKCYFHVNINLSLKKWDDFGANGEA